ncbi:unnamed protein product [Parajaminaea phylloscopi]
MDVLEPGASSHGRPASEPQGGPSNHGSPVSPSLHEGDDPLPKQPPRPIQRLEEAVVNRIAAGEIIHRPANALKELIENSIDAGATLVQIVLKDGGLKSLQIRDNGSGIPPSDLPLLCERFATSKLRRFDDLAQMTTFGFRGEALASISFVSANMNVVTKTAAQDLAYRACYANGALAPARPGLPAEPKPCAGTDGTIITAQDLFFNVPQRRRALKSAAEEYNRCLDVAAKYALHYGSRGVGFNLRKAESNAADLSTPSSPSTKALDTIRLLHGTSVARDLVHLHPPPNDALGFHVQGWISSANWSAKRTTFLCFINNRLVDCNSLKRSLETLYASVLPKGAHPWIYLSIEIDPARVDVNVHPTKREVHFLDEDETVEAICTHAQEALAGANTRRTFQFTQTQLPVLDATTGTHRQQHVRDPLPTDASSQARPTVRASQNPQYQVRVDSKTRTLDSMFGIVPSQPAASVDTDARQENFPGAESQAVAQDGGVAASRNHRVAVPQSQCSLTSILQLRREVTQLKHSELSEILQEHTFVGVVDVARSLSLLQHGTKLYLIDHDAFIEEACYQLCLRQFGSVQKTRLEPGVSLEELVRMGIDLEAGPVEDASSQGDSEKPVDTSRFGGLTRDEAVDRLCALLRRNASMLDEYFSLDIDDVEGKLIGIPCLLPKNPPSGDVASSSGSAPTQSDDSRGSGHEAIASTTLPLVNLPAFLARLGPQVDWSDEKACFESFARELAYAHTLARTVPQAPVDHGGVAEAERGRRPEHNQVNRDISHTWMPLLASLCRRGIFHPPRKLIKEQRLIQVASLNDLYRIFERC